MPSPLPALFVSHGAPTLVIDNVPTREFLMDLGERLPRPRAILAVSAHWDTDASRLTTGTAPHTMYDFYGFPEALYEMKYPAPGAVDVAARALELLGQAGIAAQGDASRGYDHGAWVPLALMYPEAQIPVAQLSIQTRRSPAEHLALGRALAPLREEGVLILASGNATHNLRDVFNHDMLAAPVPYAKDFADWLTANVEAGATAPLLNYLEQGPHGPRNHPTADHYLPLLVALGAGGGKGRLLHDGYTYGVLSMAAYAWG
ncbi:MAG: dioxygenase [Desulfovibrionaceae bacterium CG1_02_65_16]|nr:MAG: dioxygenase [Desulfovibrionaceae bacterium CG1_02_65_16]